MSCSKDKSGTERQRTSLTTTYASEVVNTEKIGCTEVCTKDEVDVAKGPSNGVDLDSAEGGARVNDSTLLIEVFSTQDHLANTVL